MSLTFEDFGGRIASVWSELRPITRGLVERALQTTGGQHPARGANTASAPYDARSDHELSRLLAALDERAVEPDSQLGADQERELQHTADACALVLQEKSRSAEVFTQLVQRADNRRDYARIDSLADVLMGFAPSEVCELARSPHVVVRALASETLAQFPVPALVSLLHDPVDSSIAREALRRKALDYGSEEARQILNVLSQNDLVGDDF
ncbi:MAG TPA: hypothetical protein VLL54_22010 [Pyrinomonadaceae bacterium]|nr:hypothetical protein [Pyrinomonadaceae bacterium]